jgi:hypothetical protein
MVCQLSGQVQSPQADSTTVGSANSDFPGGGQQRAATNATNSKIKFQMRIVL